VKILSDLLVPLTIVVCASSAFAQQNIPLKSVLSAPISNVTHVEKARNAILAHNVIRSANVTYLSGGVVELKAGFHVASGANFHAMITSDFPENSNEVRTDEEFIFKVYPNPVAENTQIEYYLPEESSVNLSLINLGGTEISRPVRNQIQGRGTHKVSFESKHLQSGMYTCILETPTVRKVYKVFKQ
jgi:hypothetical protein